MAAVPERVYIKEKGMSGWSIAIIAVAGLAALALVVVAVAASKLPSLGVGGLRTNAPQRRRGKRGLDGQEEHQGG